MVNMQLFHYRHEGHSIVMECPIHMIETAPIETAPRPALAPSRHSCRSPPEPMTRPGRASGIKLRT